MKMQTLRASQGRRGAVSLMVLMALPILIAGGAFAIDLGVLQLHRERLQRVADAGAIAGAMEFDANSPSVPKQVAEAYVRDQGNPGADGQVSATPQATCDPNLQHLDITVDENVPTFFLHFFGIASEKAHAAASVETDERVIRVDGKTGTTNLGVLAPIALNADSGAGDFVISSQNLNSMYWMLEYDGSPAGPAGLSPNLEGFASGGSAGPVRVGDVLKIHSDRMDLSLLTRGLNTRLQSQDTSESTNTATPVWARTQDPSVMVVPVASDQGDGTVKVVRFAAVRISNSGDGFAVKSVKVILPNADFDLTARKGDRSKNPNPSVFGIRLVK